MCIVMIDGYFYDSVIGFVWILCKGGVEIILFGLGLCYNIWQL